MRVFRLWESACLRMAALMPCFRVLILMNFRDDVLQLWRAGKGSGSLRVFLFRDLRAQGVFEISGSGSRVGGEGWVLPALAPSPAVSPTGSAGGGAGWRRCFFSFWGSRRVAKVGSLGRREQQL